MPSKQQKRNWRVRRPFPVALQMLEKPPSKLQWAVLRVVKQSRRRRRPKPARLQGEVLRNQMGVVKQRDVQIIRALCDRFYTSLQSNRSINLRAERLSASLFIAKDYGLVRGFRLHQRFL